MTSQQLANRFHSATPKPVNDNQKRPSPFCIRLTPDERAYLERLAGDRPLGGYIRDRLLSGKAVPRRELRQPRMEKRQYATLLAALGQSRLSSNMNQIAKAANMGTLDVNKELEQELHDAYKVIMIMRETLFMALGLKPDGSK